MKAHTLKNPLILDCTESCLKLNKPWQVGSQELVSKSIAYGLLNALILAQLQMNIPKPNLHENSEVSLLISQAIKKATE